MNFLINKSFFLNILIKLENILKLETVKKSKEAIAVRKRIIVESASLATYENRNFLIFFNLNNLIPKKRQFKNL